MQPQAIAHALAAPAHSLVLVVDFAALSQEDRASICAILSKPQPTDMTTAPVPYCATPSDAQLPPPIRSYPITLAQGRALLESIDQGTKKVLRHIARQYDPATGRGETTWLEIREILFGIDANAPVDKDAWNKFAKGHRPGLHRSLRWVVGDPKATMLIQEEDNRYYIDAPAILSLRDLFGLT